MRLRISHALLALVPFAGVASSQGTDEYGPWYLQIGGGAAWAETDDDAPNAKQSWKDGYSLNGLLGWEFANFGKQDRWGLAAEFEFFYTSSDSDSSRGFIDAGANSADRLDQWALFFNGILDSQISESISVYAGGGVGWMPRIDIDSKSDGAGNYRFDDRDAFAWQVKGGMEWRLDSNFSWILGYRYYATDDLDMDFKGIGFAPGFELENRVQVAELGLRWYL